MTYARSLPCVALFVLTVALFGAGAVAGRGAPQRTAHEDIGALLSAMAGLPIPLPARSAGGKIKHVVIIMQENRGMDDLFQAYPGADTRPYGVDQNGNQIPLQPIPLEAPYDIEHDLFSFALAYDKGKMDGFSNEGLGCDPSCPPNAQYGYVPATETKPYFDMAGQYVLADRMFASHVDTSFISHQYIISGQANSTGYVPNSYWGCDGGPSDTVPTMRINRTLGPRIPVCWNVRTLGDELDRAHRTWHFYATAVNGDGGIWSAYQVIKHIRYGPDWAKDVIAPQNRVLTDVQHGILSNVTWITPTCATSDHAACGSNLGPSWVTSIVNTIGQSKFWDSTAIFVLWDEWGGWYDHVPPPYLDFDGLGMRVPLLVISPYAKQGYVSHVQYEEGSLLRFAEDQFGLRRLAASDTRANSPALDCFDFSQPPRAFTPFASKLGPEYFIHAPPDLRVPDAE
jgi:phospholipase C